MCEFVGRGSTACTQNIRYLVMSYLDLHKGCVICQIYMRVYSRNSNNKYHITQFP